MNKPFRPGGFLRDPMFRSRFQHMIRRKAGARRNVPGQDYARPQQAMNAVKGYGTYRAAGQAPVNLGKQLQQFYRNRANEQPRTAQPSQANPVQYAPYRRG